MNGPWGLSAEEWLTIANRALAAIGREGARQLVLVPGIGYTGAHSWIASGTTVMGNVVDALNNFAFALLCGQVIGTYSSIAIAAPLVLIYSKVRGTASLPVARSRER